MVEYLNGCCVDVNGLFVDLSTVPRGTWLFRVGYIRARLTASALAVAFNCRRNKLPRIVH